MSVKTLWILAAVERKEDIRKNVFILSLRFSLRRSVLLYAFRLTALSPTGKDKLASGALRDLRGIHKSCKLLVGLTDSS